MGSKARNTNYDILDKILSDGDAAQRLRDRFRSNGNGDAEGTWITSKEQFDDLYKSIDDIEKYLRS